MLRLGASWPQPNKSHLLAFLQMAFIFIYMSKIGYLRLNRVKENSQPMIVVTFQA